MLKRFLKGYLANSSLHGLHYVGEGKTWIERLTWAALSFMAFSAAGLLMAKTLQENADNPFVTTMEQIPVQEMPFPAVSIKHKILKSNGSVRPWDNLATNILNNAYFDCFGKQECLRPESLKELSSLVDQTVAELFENLYTGFLNNGKSTVLIRKGMFLKLFCDRVELLLKGGNSLLTLMSEDLTGNDRKASIIMKDLAVRLFRLPKSRLVENMRKLYKFDIGSNSSCYNPSLYRPEVSAAAYAWFFSLGSQFPEVSLAKVLLHHADKFGMQNKPKKLEGYWRSTVAKALEAEVWSRKERLPAFEIMTFVSNFFDPTAHARDGKVKLPRWLNLNSSRCGERGKLGVQGHVPFCKGRVMFEQCCKVEQLMTSNFRRVLKVMKYMLPEPNWHIYEKEKIKDTLKALDVMGYRGTNARPLRSYYPPRVLGLSIFDKREKFGGKQPRFKNSYSNDGISLTFNSDPFQQLFKNTTTIREAYEEFFESFDSSGQDGPLYPPTGGYSFGLNAVIGRGSLALAVHEPKALPNFKMTPIFLKAGHSYTIGVTPYIITVDKTVDQLDFNDKGCMSAEDEHNLTLFRRYNYANCIFECQLKRVTSKCSCIPWNFPRWSDDYPVCHTGGSRCFLFEMRSGILPSKCSCMNDCTIVTHSYSVESRTIDYNTICGATPLVGRSVWSYFEGTQRNDFDILLEISGPESALPPLLKEAKVLR